MADSKVQQEPSIEEILSSIRQIINEEDDAPVHAAVETAPPKPSHLADNDDDVLDLASIAKPNMAKPAPAPIVEAPKAAPTPPPVPTPAPKPAALAPNFDAEPDIELEEAKVTEKASPSPAAAMPVPPAIDETVISNQAANAAIASLSKLAQADVMIDHKHAAGIGSVTLEDVVKEMLRPMVKSWIDENLPPLVERLVQREIEKLSKRV